MVIAALAAGCGGSEEDAREPPATTAAETHEASAPRGTIEPHPPRSEGVLRFLREHEEAATANERLTDVARDMLPADVEVWCWEEEIWSEAQQRIARELGEVEVTYAGIADQYAHHIHLHEWVCAELEELAPGSADDEYAQAAALSIFTHETRHFSSTGSLEAATECAALQRMDEVGVLLGGSDPHVEELQRIAWEEQYPALPAEYRSPQCKAGGVLDREPETPEFP
jgi:hypothetical protein